MTQLHRITVTLDREVAEELLDAASADLPFALRLGRRELGALRAALDQTPSGEECPTCGGGGLISAEGEAVVGHGTISVPESAPCPDCTQPSGEEGEGENWPESVVIRRYTDLPGEFWAAGPPADGMHDVAGQEARRYVPEPIAQEAPQVSSGSLELFREAIYQELTGKCGLPDMELVCALDRAGEEFRREEPSTLTGEVLYERWNRLLIDSGAEPRPWSRMASEDPRESCLWRDLAIQLVRPFTLTDEEREQLGDIANAIEESEKWFGRTFIDHNAPLLRTLAGKEQR